MIDNMCRDINERKGQNIYFKRRRSRRKITQNDSTILFNRSTLALFSIVFIIAVSFFKGTNGQFPGFANAVWGKDSYLPGIKKIVGGVLAADITHSKCTQKMLCDEMAPEIIEMTDTIDPVKRTIVRIPRLVKPRGRLRWLGDAVVNTVSRVSRRIGIDPNEFGKSNRRQAVPSSLVTKAVSGAMGVFKGIPVEMVMHSMDFLADATNFFDRKGAIYPYARAATIGYWKGGAPTRRGDDEYSGVCNQVSEDKCAMDRVSDEGGHRWTGWWSHLPTANQYEAGTLSRTNTNNELSKSSLNRAGLERDSALNNQWNFLNPSDIFKPRVFVCKAGRFLDTMSYQMGGDGSVKSRDEGEFGSEQFENSCDPADLLEKTPPTLENTDTNAAEEQVFEASQSSSGDGTEGGEDVNHTVAVIDARNGSAADFKLPDHGNFKLPPDNQVSSFHDLPILVLEGLQKPRIDQTEEELVSDLLSDMVSGIPKNSVRTAIRLPLTQQTNGKSIVLVELDTEQHEDLILKQRNALREGSLNTIKRDKIQEKNIESSANNKIANINDKFLLQRWKNLGIRRAKFKELWKFVEELAVVKRVTNIPHEDNSDDIDSNKIEANTFLFGTAAETSLDVIDNKKNHNNKSSTSALPPRVVVRKKTPLHVSKGLENKDSKSNDVK